MEKSYAYCLPPNRIALLDSRQYAYDFSICSQSVVLGIAAAAAPGSLLEIHISNIAHTPDLLNQEL